MAHNICPVCQMGELCPSPFVIRCSGCGFVLTRDLLENLHQIRSLPEAKGEHACECGHPEMRRLPDGVFHCPACRAEVVPHVRASPYSG